MRIKRLELNGFKSFMERTVLELPAGITGIVGPNGCGKSNIVDAIRWAIGEQSVKHLRGDAMEDVICNGNAETGALGMAEVSLLLAREEAELAAAGSTEGDTHADSMTLPPELRQASEILVTRRYFRSGESEYFINRVPCRLKDITEFFLGTGVGTKAYAIIEQGRIEQIVNAKPEDLRLFIEEAAGVTRFRTRRIAAERKLHRTRENLLRVQDVLRELERQKALLERQARRAEEFHRVRDELRALDLQIMARRFAGWTVELQTLEGRLGDLRMAEAHLQDQIRSRIDSTVGVRSQRVALEAEIGRVEERLADERVAAREAETQAGGLAARHEDLIARSREGTRLVDELRSRLTEVDEHLSGLHVVARQLAAEATEARAAHDAAERQLRELVEQGAPLEQAVEQAKDAVLGGLTEESRLRNLVEALTLRRTDIEGRRQRVDEEQRQLAGRLQGNARAATAIRVGLEGVTTEHRALEARRHEVVQERADQLVRVQTQEEELESARAALGRLRSRADSLRELQARREGCTRGVATILSRGEGSASLLADALRVPATLERAVAAALGARLAQVVVDDTAAALETISCLTVSGGGSATVLPLRARRRAPAIVTPGRRLLDEIDVDSRLWGLAEALLGRVLVVDTLEEGSALWESAAHEVTVVTLAGEAIDAVGAVTGGSEPPLEETLLARIRELRELTRAEEAATTREAECQVALRTTRDTLAATERDQIAVDDRLQTLRLQRLAHEKDRERLEEERGHLSAELEVWALEAGGLAGAGDEVTLEIARLQRSQTEAEVHLAERRVELEARQEAVLQWRREHEGAEERRTAAAVAAAACGERRRATDTELARSREGRQDLIDRLAGAEREVSEANEGAGRIEAERLAALGVQAASEAAIAELANERDRQRAAIVAAEAALAADDDVLGANRAELEARREERGSLEVALAERRIAIEHLLGQLAERYELGSEALISAEDAGEGVEPGEEQVQRAERLRNRLGQLGDVNPGAVTELDELKGRYDFLVAQRADLEHSLEDLRRTIAKLLRTSRERFEETFLAANEKLNMVFPKLFPDGKARLQLTTPEEGEDPGVEIVVQPAGKKLQHLSLLSGGEKALTATALVLALFLIRPTPFCLLDEVDAPLDEANIGRFNHVVREMAESCQFVLITHNRRTMEVADTLYGITMEQPGVSKVVSVRLREAA